MKKLISLWVLITTLFYLTAYGVHAKIIYSFKNNTITITYKSKRGKVVYEPLDWLAAITSHIPNKGTQNVHYFGFYSNKSRGLRKKSEREAESEILITDATTTKKSCSKRWASLIKKIYEVDPLTCPRCSHQMRIISIIEKSQTIQKILKHLNLWQPQAHGPPMSEDSKIIEDTIYDYNFFDYLHS